MDFQMKKSELLERMEQGDADASSTVVSLVSENSLRPEQLPEVLMSAARGWTRQGPGTKTLYLLEGLVRLIAYKMPSETVHGFHDIIMSALKNPDNVGVEDFIAISMISAVLVKEGRIKNGHLLETADAVAEGLEKTRDYVRSKSLENVGTAVRGKLPSDDIERIYESVYTLLTAPAGCRGTGPMAMILKAYMSRMATGKMALDERVFARMERTLNPPPTPLSEGSAKLPLPPMARQPPRKMSAVDVAAGIGRKLAYRNKQEQS